MKEELQKIRDIGKELPEMIDSFNIAVAAFETEVSVNSKLATMLEDYFESDCDCYYEAAMGFYEMNYPLYAAAAKLKEEHPRYQDKSIKKNLMEMLNDGEDLAELGAKIELYIALKNIGFAELVEQQEKIIELEDEMGILKSDVKEETKQKVIDTGRKVVDSVYNVARPYGEIARGQLAAAGDKAKEAAHNGSKKLARLFDSLADRISNNE